MSTEDLRIRGDCSHTKIKDPKVHVGQPCSWTAFRRCTSQCQNFTVALQDVVVCFACGHLFDLLSAKMCTGHPTAITNGVVVLAKVTGLDDISEVRSPVCPICRTCLCFCRDLKAEDFKPAQGKWKSIGLTTVYKPWAHILVTGITCECQEEDCACIHTTANDSRRCDFCEEGQHTPISQDVRIILRKYGANM